MSHFAGQWKKSTLFCCTWTTGMMFGDWKKVEILYKIQRLT